MERVGRAPSGSHEPVDGLDGTALRAVCRPWEQIGAQFRSRQEMMLSVAGPQLRGARAPCATFAAGTPGAS